MHWRTLEFKFLLVLVLVLLFLINCSGIGGFFSAHLIPWYIGNTMLSFDLMTRWRFRLKKQGPGPIYLGIIKNLDLQVQFLWVSDVSPRNSGALSFWSLASEGFESLMNLDLHELRPSRTWTLNLYRPRALILAEAQGHTPVACAFPHTCCALWICYVVLKILCYSGAYKAVGQNINDNSAYP